MSKTMKLFVLSCFAYVFVMNLAKFKGFDKIVGDPFPAIFIVLSSLGFFWFCKKILKKAV